MNYNIKRHITGTDLEAWLQDGLILGDGEQSCWLAWGETFWSDTPPAGMVAFYAPDFFLENQKPWLNFRQVAQLPTVELLEVMAEHEAQMPRWQWQAPDLEEFSKAFHLAKAKMEEGLFAKVVPVVMARSNGRPSASERLHLLRSLLQRQVKGQMVYGFWNDQEGMIGLSPEKLFQLEGSHLKTMALAGTGRAIQDLLNDPKERHEHELVIEFIVKKLGRWGKVQWEDTHEWDLGSLKHLRTFISVATDQKMDFLTAIQLLHPTPALGVAPEEVNWRWLRELPGSDRRGRFGAPFGIVGPENWALVAIRNIQWNSDDLRLGSGCGIVSQSVLEREWQELSLKRQSVLRAFDL